MSLLRWRQDASLKIPPSDMECLTPLAFGHAACYGDIVKYLGDPSSGSQAGTTASRNRFGQYYRTRATPVNVNSTQQGVVRSRMAANSSAWRALTGAQRAGWTSL